MQPLAGERRTSAIDTCLMFALAIILLIVYGRAFGSDLVFDSHFIIHEDTRLREFSSSTLADIFTKNYWWPSMYSNLYRPLTTLAFNIQYSILGFADKPAGYQLINLGLHFLALWITFRLLVRMHMPRWASFSAVLWLGIHPYATEVIPNIVGLSDLLAYLSVAAGLHVYLSILEGTKTYCYGGLQLIIVAALGILAKENAISLLAIIIWHGCTLGKSSILPLFFQNRKLNRARLATTIAASILVISIAITPKIIHQDRELPDFDPVIADNPLRGESAINARINALAILGDNMLNCLVPRTISADYSYGQIPLAQFKEWNTEDFRVLSTASLVIIFGLVGLRFAKSAPSFSFAIGATFALALPTANVILLIGTIRADRLVYPVILPLTICAGIVATHLWRRLERRLDHVMIKKARHAIVVFLAIYVVMVCTITHLRATDWRTTEGFWNAAYATSPNSFKTKLGAASARKATTIEEFDRDIAQMEDAISQLEASPHESVRMNDGAWEFIGFRLIERARLLIELGNKKRSENDLHEAEKWFLRSLELKKSRMTIYAERYANDPKMLRETRVSMDTTLIVLSEIYRHFGDYERACALLRKEYNDNKLSSKYLKALGRAEADVGNWQEGSKQLLKVVLLSPDDTSTSREAAWLIEKKSPSESSRPMRSTKRNQEETSPLLDISSPALDQLGAMATQELINDLNEEERTKESRLLARQIRVRLSRQNWLPNN